MCYIRSFMTTFIKVIYRTMTKRRLHRETSNGLPSFDLSLFFEELFYHLIQAVSVFFRHSSGNDARPNDSADSIVP